MTRGDVLSTGVAICEPEFRFSLSPSDFAVECGMKGQIISEAFGAMHHVNRHSERRVAVGFPLMVDNDIGGTISFAGDEEIIGLLHELISGKLKNGAAVIGDPSPLISGELMAFHRNRIPEKMTVSFKKRILKRAEVRGKIIAGRGKNGKWEPRAKSLWGPHAVLRSPDKANSINMLMSRPNREVPDGPLMVNTYGLSTKPNPAFIRF